MSGVDHRTTDGRERRFTLFQFFFEAADQMHSEVDGQPDEHRSEGDGQDVEMADHQGGVPHRVAEADQQRDHGLLRSAAVVVSDEEEQGAQDQGDDRGPGRIRRGLLHFIDLENGFSGQPHIDA